MPKSELVPLAQFVHSLPEARLPLCISGGSPSLIRVIEDNRNDGKRFIAYVQFSEEVFLQCVRQAHQDVFGMVEVTSLVDYVILRLKSAVYEDWTEGKHLLRKCIRQGFVAFGDLRELLTDLIALWSTIRPYIRCTGLPHVKDQPDSVSCFHFASFVLGIGDSFVLVRWLRSVDVIVLFQLRGMDHTLISDGLVTYRFGLLQLMLDTCKLDAYIVLVGVFFCFFLCRVGGGCVVRVARVSFPFPYL